MIKNIPELHPIVFILVATIFEVTGDALIRMSIYNHSGAARVGLMAVGAILLFVYGFSLNLAPVEFGKVVGLYISTLFVVWQLINFISFQTMPATPTILGGVMIVVGGLIITFWK